MSKSYRDKGRAFSKSRKRSGSKAEAIKKHQERRDERRKARDQ